MPILLHLVQRREPPTVVFPAVRYLIDATREHQRRLRIQHWLLLARAHAAHRGAGARGGGSDDAPPGVAGHAPSALVLVLDNSASSAAVVGGTPRLDSWCVPPTAVLARATPADALWLITGRRCAAAR